MADLLLAWEEVEGETGGVNYKFSFAVEFFDEVGSIPAAEVGSGEELIGGKHTGVNGAVGSVDGFHGNEVVGISMSEVSSNPHVPYVGPALWAVAAVMEYGQSSGFFVFRATRHFNLADELHRVVGPAGNGERLAVDHQFRPRRQRLAPEARGTDIAEAVNQSAAVHGHSLSVGFAGQTLQLLWVGDGFHVVLRNNHVAGQTYLVALTSRNEQAVPVAAAYNVAFVGAVVAA